MAGRSGLLRCGRGLMSRTMDISSPYKEKGISFKDILGSPAPFKEPRQHFSDSKAMVTLICDGCGIEFKKKKGHWKLAKSRGQQKFYHNRECPGLIKRTIVFASPTSKWNWGN